MSTSAIPSPLLSSIDAYLEEWDRVPSADQRVRIQACIDYMGPFGEWLSTYELENASPFLFSDGITSFRALHHQIYSPEPTGAKKWALLRTELRSGLISQLAALVAYSQSQDHTGLSTSMDTMQLSMPELPATFWTSDQEKALLQPQLDLENRLLDTKVGVLRSLAQLTVQTATEAMTESLREAVEYLGHRRQHAFDSELQTLSKALQSGTPDASIILSTTSKITELTTAFESKKSDMIALQGRREGTLTHQISALLEKKSFPAAWSVKWHPGYLLPSWKQQQKPMKKVVVVEPKSAKEDIPKALPGVKTVLTKVVEVAPAAPGAAAPKGEEDDEKEEKEKLVPCAPCKAQKTPSEIAEEKLARENQNRLGIPAPIGSATDLINAMSGGMARRGIPIGMPHHYWKHLPRLPILDRLTTTEFGPSYHPHTFRDEQFHNQEESTTYSSIVRNNGWSLSLSAAAMGVTAGATAETQRGKTRTSNVTSNEQQLILKRLQYIPIRSFYIEEKSKLSGIMWKRAMRIQNEDDADEFLEDFYSHISTGTHHVGGIHTQVVEVTAEQSASLFEMKEFAASRFSANLGFGPVSASAAASMSTESSSLISKSSHRFIAKEGVESQGIAATDASDYIAELTANPAQWYLVDRGDLVDFVPVWDLLLGTLQRRPSAHPSPAAPPAVKSKTKPKSSSRKHASDASSSKASRKQRSTEPSEGVEVVQEDDGSKPSKDPLDGEESGESPVETVPPPTLDSEATTIRKAVKLIIQQWLQMARSPELWSSEPRYLGIIRKAEKRLAEVKRLLNEEPLVAQNMNLRVAHYGDASVHWDVTRVLAKVIQVEERLLLPKDWTLLFGTFPALISPSLTLSWGDSPPETLYPPRARHVRPAGADLRFRQVSLAYSGALVCALDISGKAALDLPTTHFGAPRVVLELLWRKTTFSGQLKLYLIISWPPSRQAAPHPPSTATLLGDGIQIPLSQSLFRAHGRVTDCMVKVKLPENIRSLINPHIHITSPVDPAFYLEVPIFFEPPVHLI